MIPIVDFGHLLESLENPTTWWVAGVLVVVALVGWRLGSETYWRVAFALIVGASGAWPFFVAGGTPGLWPGYALCMLISGYLLYRAHRLRRVSHS